MPGEQAESSDQQRQLAVLSWLFKCYRNLFLAVEPVPPAVDLPGWAQGVGAASRTILYEPRSLAVSSDGPLVAVGTKAGAVYVASWNSARQHWQICEDLPGRVADPPPRAIRGVTILDRRTVAAGFGLGWYRIVELTEGDPPEVAGVKYAKPEGGTAGRDRLERVNRVIRLFPAGRRPQAGGPLALGVSLGLVKLHVLRGNASAYSVTSHPVEELLDWDQRWGRLVAGGWWHGLLWLLSSAGQIICYEPDPDAGHRPPRLPLRRADQEPFPVPVARATAFSGLDGCVMGLSVLTTDAVTFLRFRSEAGKPIELARARPRWFAVSSAQDCTVCYPYYPEELTPKTVVQSRVTGENPVWTVVSRRQGDLRWIQWPDDHDPMEAPGRYVGSTVLFARFGFAGPHKPPFLAYATRDHHLEIVSVLDRPKCEDEIKQRMVDPPPGALRPDSPLATIGGAKLWALLRRIDREFGFEQEASSDPEWLLEKPFDIATRDDLRRLLRHVLRAWEGQRPGHQLDNPAAATRKVVSWTLELLKQAHYFGPEMAGELAASVFDRVVRGRGGATGAVDSWRDLGLFALFLRKWIVRGFTYGEKSTGLFQLYMWNRACERNLDAVVYLARLMRQRVDARWELAPSHSLIAPTIWTLASATEADGQPLFTVAAFTDGNLYIVSHEGKKVAWDADPVRLNRCRLAIDPDDYTQSRGRGMALSHLGAGSFREKYRHGPYARSLLLERLDSGGDASQPPLFLLFFCLRGWRRDDRNPRGEQGPLACTLLLRPDLKDEELPVVRVIDVATLPVSQELYGLAGVPLDGAAAKRRILAGTPGVWGDPGGPLRPLPFVEIEVSLETDCPLSMTVCETRVDLAPEGQRSLFRNPESAPDTAYNPCWRMVCLEAPEGVRVWAGFGDGSIRGYARRRGGEGAGVKPGCHWIEGGWTPGRKSDDDPRRIGLKVTASVWTLQLLAAEQDEPMLAYGTGDGTLGVVALRDLEAPTSEVGRTACHIVHTREGAPICGLCFLSLDHPLLLGLSQRGTVSIFSLAPQVADDRVRDGRAWYRGQRLDRFDLPHAVGAGLVVEDAAGRGLIVGSDEGALVLYDLRYMRRCGQRREVRHFFRELMGGREEDGAELEEYAGNTTADLVAAVGPEKGLEWLRVFHLGEGDSGTHLIEFSLWQDLWSHAPTDLRQADLAVVKRQLPAAQRQPEPVVARADLPAQVARYTARLKELSHEVYNRRLFSREPAKMLWAVTGRIAHEILENAVRGAGDEAALGCHFQLIREIDDLSNRWIGYEQAIEARILAHSFESLFGWCEIVVIAGWNLSSAKTAEIASFLLRNLIQRRLYHGDPIVPLETLRVVNGALRFAIQEVRARRRLAPGRPWDLALRKEDGGERAGYFDLMAMVGDLGERLADGLTLAEPLATEILAFFALSLLLFPNSSLIVGQTVSESRLAQRGTSFAGVIVRMAGQLRAELGLGDDDAVNRALERFDAYFNGEADLSLIDYDSTTATPPAPREQAWRYLLWTADQEASRGAAPGELTDRSFLSELQWILLGASWLSRLEPADDPQPPTRKAREATIVAELQRGPQRWQYFKHSAEYLMHLKKVRETLQESVSAAARDLCDHELRLLGTRDLFEPQPRHYRAVLVAWRDQVIRSAERAAEALQTLDEFNSHVFRTSADHLMTSVRELAMQIAPLSFDERFARDLVGNEWQALHDGSIRLLIRRRLEGRPLMRDVFERGDRLVDYSHLSGALLVLARSYLPGRGSASATMPGIIVKEFRDELVDAGLGWGLIRSAEGGWVPPLLAADANERVPGNVAIWSAIFREFATNVATYSRAADGSQNEGERPTLCANLLGGSGGNRSLLVAGTFPYLRSVRPELLAEFKNDRGEVDRSKVLEHLATLGRRAGSPRPSRSGGMGLFLIAKISSLLQISYDLILFDVRTSYQESYGADLPPEDLWQLQQGWPLCLKLTWTRFG